MTSGAIIATTPSTDTSDGHRLAWGHGDAIAGTPFRELISSEATAGRLAVLASDMPTGRVVAEHVHDDEDQITIVVRGAVGASLANRQFHLGEGAVLFMPRGIPHKLWNAGDEPARLLELYTPGGFEQVFHTAGAAALAGERTFFT